MQEILVLIIFILAAFYIGRKFYLDFTAKDACPKGCGACEITKESIQ